MQQLCPAKDAALSGYFYKGKKGTTKEVDAEGNKYNQRNAAIKAAYGSSWSRANRKQIELKLHSIDKS